MNEFRMTNTLIDKYYNLEDQIYRQILGVYA